MRELTSAFNRLVSVLSHRPLSLYGPVNATLPPRVAGAGAQIQVVTDYPFGDEVHVSVTGVTKPTRLRLRVPGWSRNATVVVNGGREIAASPMQFFEVSVEAGSTHVLLNLNPDIQVETGWGNAGTDAAVVRRGALLYALGLDENVELLHSPWACFDSGCSVDMAIHSTRNWTYALVLPSKDMTQHMRFERTGTPGPIPFASANSSVRIVVSARGLRTWGMDTMFPTSAAHPPSSPVQCDGSRDCGPVEQLQLVPYGNTRLRVGMFPWTSN